MSDHIPDATKMVCPHCEAGVLIMENGKECRSANGSWVCFACLTSIHEGQDPRTGQSFKCEKAERDRLILGLTTLRTANAALVERVKRIEAAADKLAQRHLLVPTTYPQAQAHVAEYHREKGEA